MNSEILETNDQVKGEIYCITNILNQRMYVGQTVTHRKNRGKWRPFGSIGRFKDHVSEAMCNTKKKQCWYLNSAIRKYGSDQFEVKLLESCEVNELDEKERYYIAQFGSIYPNGYNLTAGGKTTASISIIPDQEPTAPGTRGGCKYRSGETRSLISNRLQNALASDSARQMLSERTRQQHLANKFQRFKDVPIDVKNLDAYVHQHMNRVVIKLNGQKITFASKHSTPEERLTQAHNFLLQLANSATLPN